MAPLYSLMPQTKPMMWTWYLIMISSLFMMMMMKTFQGMMKKKMKPMKIKIKSPTTKW